MRIYDYLWRTTKLSQQPETNRIEYKRELNDKLERSVVAFLKAFRTEIFELLAPNESVG